MSRPSLLSLLLLFILRPSIVFTLGPFSGERLVDPIRPVPVLVILERS